MLKKGYSNTWMSAQNQLVCCRPYLRPVELSLPCFHTFLKGANVG